MPEVIAAGHLCVDIIPRIPPGSQESANFLAPGRLSEVGELLLSTGGATSNTGLALHKLGVDVSLVARLGDDIIADLIRQILAGFGSHLIDHLTIARGEPSSYTIVINPPDVDRTFLHCPGTNNTFGAEDVSKELLAQTRLFHFGYPPIMRRMYSNDGEELVSLLQRAKAQGTTTSLDMTMPDPNQPSGQADWRLILSRALPLVDIFVPSVEELLFMLARDRFDDLNRMGAEASLIDRLTADEISSLAEDALALGAKIALIKLGHRGIYLRTHAIDRDLGRATPKGLSRWEHRELWTPAFEVKVMGTVGAGDAAIAGFLTALLRGQTPEQAVRSASAVGACSVETADAVSGVQSWEATRERLGRPWRQMESHVRSDGWKMDRSLGLWRGPHDRR